MIHLLYFHLSNLLLYFLMKILVKHKELNCLNLFENINFNYFNYSCHFDYFNNFEISYFKINYYWNYDRFYLI